MGQESQAGLELDARRDDLHSLPPRIGEASKPYYVATSYEPDGDQYDKRKTQARGLRYKRNPFGLSPLWFGIAAAVVGFIIGGALIGGLAGGLTQYSAPPFILFLNNLTLYIGAALSKHSPFVLHRILPPPLLQPTPQPSPTTSRYPTSPSHHS